MVCFKISVLVLSMCDCLNVYLYLSVCMVLIVRSQANRRGRPATHKLETVKDVNFLTFHVNWMAIGEHPEATSKGKHHRVSLQSIIHGAGGGLAWCACVQRQHGTNVHD